MGIDVLVPDVNRSLAEFAPDRSGDPDQARPAIVFGLAAVRNVGESLVERIVAERDANGPFADIFDFCAAGRPRRPQQADDGVAGQGRRFRLARPSTPGPVPRPRGRRRPNARAPPRAGPRHHHALRRLRGGAGRPRMGRGQGRHPRHRVRQGPTPGLREGDARPLRERPPAHGLRGGPGPAHRQHPVRHARRGPRGGGPLARADGRRGGDRPAPVLHEEGRPDGPLRPGGPAGGHGGLRVPQDDGRVRRPSSRTTPSSW